MTVVDAAALRGRRVLRTGVCVIGSGAGGAPVAAEAAAGGRSVVVLEEGPRHRPEDLTARPRDMTALLYRDGGQTATVGAPPIVLPLGRGLGGTTLVNSGTCFRPPDAVLERWVAEYGLDELAPAALAPALDHVEDVLGVTPVPEEHLGASARIVRRGAAALGVEGAPLRRTAPGCRGSGVCAFGCPSGAKRHTAQAWLPRAFAHGAVALTGARAERVVVRGGRASEVLARTAGGGRLRVVCDDVVVACGTLHTPGLLARSGLRSAALGEGLTIHPASAARALFDEDLEPWRGVPQSYFVDALAGDGIMLEGIAGPPDQAAMATPGSGAEHRERMLLARRTASFGVMVSDTARGRVRSVRGRPVARYDLHPRDAERFRRGFALLAEIFFAAGAREVLVPLAGVPPLRGGDARPLREARVAPRAVQAMAFHPLGTARAGADPAAAVVDGRLRVHGTANVFVADGSVVPSPPGVNPQVTIMALAVGLGRDLVSGAARRSAPSPTRTGRRSRS
ncbi:MAG TPA: GMC family oxidoreductase N-terminal domain-containing protein, partial [Solirubrobacteraceae bacterium]|nr:GMC family oxidoreductase N-terminal domain-containing protein [Solirubrobacteraceae bacterium]